MTPEQLADVVRGLLYTATNRPETINETTPLGATIGQCNATEAAAFARNVDDWTTNHLAHNQTTKQQGSTE